MIITAALLVAFALLLWAFAVLVWDLLEGRTRRWLRVVLVAMLTPACALAAAVISAVAGLALALALGPDETPAAPTGRPPAHTEPADPETTSAEGRGSETTTERTASPSATPSASPTASPTATPSPSASPSP